MKQEVYRLTQYSHGAGCGCKIAPNILDQILSGSTVGTHSQDYPALLVGNNQKDDAAAIAIDDERAILSTTDFFMPIVDDPVDFGRIAATNAISDIYAMGGRPTVAIAILGWPLDKLPPEVAGRVIAGGRQACADAGIPLAGGHSIDAPEPIFGLAVTGEATIAHLKRNAGAQPGDQLFLTKPLGIGILTTAEKQGVLQPEHARTATEAMCQLNRIGTQLAPLPGVHAMTDVTGFALLGHLLEMCDASEVGARIDLTRVPRLEGVDGYIDAGCLPGGNGRNFTAYGHRLPALDDHQRALLCDPQTSGGLLIAVAADTAAEVRALLTEAGLPSEPIGELVATASMSTPIVLAS